MKTEIRKMTKMARDMGGTNKGAALMEIAEALERRELRLRTVIENMPPSSRDRRRLMRTLED